MPAMTEVTTALIAPALISQAKVTDCYCIVRYFTINTARTDLLSGAESFSSKLSSPGSHMNLAARWNSAQLLSLTDIDGIANLRTNTNTEARSCFDRLGVIFGGEDNGHIEYSIMEGMGSWVGRGADKLCIAYTGITLQPATLKSPPLSSDQHQQIYLSLQQLL